MSQQRRNVCGYLMWLLIALPGLLLAGDAPSIGEMQARIGALLEYREPIQIDYTMTRQDFYETSQILSKGEDGRVRIANPNLIINGKPQERDGVIDEATGLPYATFSSTYAFFRFGEEVLVVDFATKRSGKTHYIEASLDSQYWDLTVQRPGTEKELYEPLPRIMESMTSHLELATYLAFCREALEAVDPGALTAGGHVQQRYTSFFDHYTIDESGRFLLTGHKQPFGDGGSMELQYSDFVDFEGVLLPTRIREIIFVTATLKRDDLVYSDIRYTRLTVEQFHAARKAHFLDRFEKARARLAPTPAP